MKSCSLEIKMDLNPKCIVHVNKILLDPELCINIFLSVTIFYLYASDKIINFHSRTKSNIQMQDPYRNMFQLTWTVCTPLLHQCPLNVYSFLKIQIETKLGRKVTLMLQIIYLVCIAEATLKDRFYYRHFPLDHLIQTNQTYTQPSIGHGTCTPILYLGFTRFN